MIEQLPVEPSVLMAVFIGLSVGYLIGEAAGQRAQQADWRELHQDAMTSHALALHCMERMDPAEREHVQQETEAYFRDKYGIDVELEYKPPAEKTAEPSDAIE